MEDEGGSGAEDGGALEVEGIGAGGVLFNVAEEEEGLVDGKLLLAAATGGGGRGGRGCGSRVPIKGWTICCNVEVKLLALFTGDRLTSQRILELEAGYDIGTQGNRIEEITL